MTRFLFWKVDVENFEHLLATRPAVVVGNHQSNLDIATWSTFFPDRSVAVGKKEILKIPVFGWLWKVAKHILIDRSNAAAARDSLAAAAERIRTREPERLGAARGPPQREARDAALQEGRVSPRDRGAGARRPVRDVADVDRPRRAPLDGAAREPCACASWRRSRRRG